MIVSRLKISALVAFVITLLLFVVHVSAQEKTRIGIVPLDYGNIAELRIFAVGTQDTLISALGEVPDFYVIDRTRINAVLKEIGFQQSEFVDKSTQTKIGKILGVQYILTGSMQKVGNRVRILIQQIDVQTGESKSVGKVTGKLKPPKTSAPRKSFSGKPFQI